MAVVVAIITANCADDRPRANLVTRPFSFTGSGFFNPLDSADLPAQDLVSGSFTVSYDPEADTTGGTLDAINLTIAGFTFTTANTAFNYNSGANRITVFGILNDTVVAGGTNDFSLGFAPVTAAPPISFACFLYSDPSDPSIPGFLADSRIPPSDVAIAASRP